MLPRLQAQLHEVRLGLRRRQLQRRERLALRRLGEEIARDSERTGHEALGGIIAEIDHAHRGLAALAAESDASMEADRTDLRRVAAWVKPVVVTRGVCTRLVLRHQRRADRGRLGARYEALGELAARLGIGVARPELRHTRAGLGRVQTELERRRAPFGGAAHPAWTVRAGVEAVGLGRAILSQLHAHLLPKAPALAGMVAGWWIANTFTDSPVRSVLRSVGIGRGGTHVVSGSTYQAMHFWLPLLAAALCAYLGERIASYYRQPAGARHPIAAADFSPDDA
jgi:hypothetical protein